MKLLCVVHTPCRTGIEDFLMTCTSAASVIVNFLVSCTTAASVYLDEAGEHMHLGSLSGA